MNERIKQLMVEADYPAPEIALRAQKFAQLIVRECISMADKESERYSNLDQEYCSMAMDNYRELVRQYFGVEDDLVHAATMMSDKGYKLSTHEKQAEFAAARNYTLGETND